MQESRTNPAFVVTIRPEHVRFGSHSRSCPTSTSVISMGFPSDGVTATLAVFPAARRAWYLALRSGLQRIATLGQKPQVRVCGIYARVHGSGKICNTIRYNWASAAQMRKLGMFCTLPKGFRRMRCATRHSACARCAAISSCAGAAQANHGKSRHFTQARPQRPPLHWFTNGRLVALYETAKRLF